MTGARGRRYDLQQAPAQAVPIAMEAKPPNGRRFRAEVEAHDGSPRIGRQGGGLRNYWLNFDSSGTRCLICDSVMGTNHGLTRAIFTEKYEQA